MQYVSAKLCYILSYIGYIMVVARRDNVIETYKSISHYSMLL